MTWPFDGRVTAIIRKIKESRGFRPGLQSRAAGEKIAAMSVGRGRK
jgi:hypothetical protein